MPTSEPLNLYVRLNAAGDGYNITCPRCGAHLKGLYRYGQHVERRHALTMPFTDHPKLTEVIKIVNGHAMAKPTGPCCDRCSGPYKDKRCQWDKSCKMPHHSRFRPKGAP